MIANWQETNERVCSLQLSNAYHSAQLQTEIARILLLHFAWSSAEINKTMQDT